MRDTTLLDYTRDTGTGRTRASGDPSQSASKKRPEPVSSAPPSDARSGFLIGPYEIRIHGCILSPPDFDRPEMDIGFVRPANRGFDQIDLERRIGARLARRPDDE